MFRGGKPFRTVVGGMRPTAYGYRSPMTPQNDSDSEGQVSEVANLDQEKADTPLADGDSTAGYPASESGDAQEPEPEAGPNANPHRDEDTH